MDEIGQQVGQEEVLPSMSGPDKDDWADWEKRIDALLLWACQSVADAAQPG